MLLGYYINNLYKTYKKKLLKEKSYYNLRYIYKNY